MGQRSIRVYKGTNQLRVQNTERVPSFISVSDVMKKHISEYDFYDKRHIFTSIEDFIDNIIKLDKDNGKQQRTDMP